MSSRISKSKATKKAEIVKGPPRSLAFASKGIRTSQDFANMMSALMSDLIEGNIPPSVGNAACNAGGKMLKAVELQMKYGTQSNNGSKKTLELTSGDNGESR